MIREIMKKISVCIENMENHIENQFKAEEIYYQQTFTNRRRNHND